MILSNQLENIRKIHDSSLGGPRNAYRYFHGHPEDYSNFTTEQVEDFIISFYIQYNELYPNTY
jgi:hypothetical protein